MPHDVATDLGLRCLPVTLFIRFPNKNGLVYNYLLKLEKKKKNTSVCHHSEKVIVHRALIISTTVCSVAVLNPFFTKPVKRS